MITASGLASGLDVDGIVTQLVQAESTPVIQRLARREAQVQADVSAIGAVRGALGGLSDALETLTADGVFARRTASSASPGHFTASAGSTAQASDYDIEVLALAQAQKLASGSFADAQTAVGTGTLNIDVGGSAFEVSIADGSQSLAEIRDAINNAADNTGARASIINDAGGARLILSAEETGLANTLTVTRSGGDGGLDALVYDPGTLENLSQIQEPLDASIKVETFSYSSASNTVTGAIDGVTLSLVQADPGTTHRLTVGLDSAAIGSALEDFTGKLNAAVEVIANVTAYNATTGSASALQGDAMMRSLSGQLRDIGFGDLGDTNDRFATLSELGIRFDGSGKLSVDRAALDTALADDFDAVVAAVTGDNGMRARYDTLLSSYIDPEAALDARTDSLQGALDRIDGDRERLDRRLSAIEARYRAQFASLETLVSQMNQTSSFLAQQLQNINLST